MEYFAYFIRVMPLGDVMAGRTFQPRPHQLALIFHFLAIILEVYVVQFVGSQHLYALNQLVAFVPSALEQAQVRHLI